MSIIKDGVLRKYTGNDANVIIPNSVTTIGAQAFYHSPLSSVQIPDSVTTINWGAFYGCSSLTSVKIPNSVTKIGCCAFQGCANLQEISLPEEIQIAENAFPATTKITFRKKEAPVLNVPNENFMIKDNTLIAYLGREKHVKILEGVKKIASSAFARCDFLFSVDIPDSVTEIHDCAFLMCPNLEKVSIPQNVKIGENVFYGCENLSTLNIRFAGGASALETMFQKL